MSVEKNFANDLIKRFKNYKDLGDKTFEQLQEEDFFYRASPESNSIAIIVQHLHGNMLSRFTNFLTEDGEKEWRNRDVEFENNFTTAHEVINAWNEGWDCVFKDIQHLSPADFVQTIYIRAAPLQVYDALLRQLAHYPYHVGQIVFIGKFLKDKNWHSLSIAKASSENFNQQMKKKYS
jgi:hypothetical protein